MEKFLGKWEVTSMENLVNVYKELGVVSEESQKKFAGNVAGKKFQTHYRQDENQPAYFLYEVVKPDGQVARTLRFRLGEAFEFNFVGERPFTCRVEVVDGKMIETLTEVKNPSMILKMIQEVVGEELIQTQTVGDVSGTVRHRRIA